MDRLRTVACVLLLSTMPACSGVLGTDTAEESAHAVFITQPGCPYVVTSDTQRSFAVLAPQDGIALQQGDLLLGNLSTGNLTVDVVPFKAETVARAVPFEVVSYGLSLAEAQAFYYGYCPLPPPPAPLAAPADSTDTF